MCANRRNFTVFHNDYAVCVLNGRNSLCNNQLGCVWYLIGKGPANQAVGVSVNRTG